MTQMVEQNGGGVKEEKREKRKGEKWEEEEKRKACVCCCGGRKIQNHWTITSNELQYYLMGKNRLKKRAGE